MPEEDIARLDIQTLLAVEEDELALVKKNGTYEQFRNEHIAEIEEVKPGLGRWIQAGIDQAKTPEEAEIVFDTAYIIYNVLGKYNNPTPLADPGETER